MAISYIGQAAGTPAANPTSESFSLPDGWAAGDLAIFVWYSRGVKAISGPAGVTGVDTDSGSSWGLMWIGYRYLQTGDTTFAWTAASVTNATTGWFTSVFRGTHPSAPFEATSSGGVGFHTGTQDPDPLVATPVSTGAAAFAVYGQPDDNNGVYTVPSGYTAAGNWSSTLGTDGASGAAYKLGLTGGTAENPGVFDTASAEDYGLVFTGIIAPAPPVPILEATGTIALTGYADLCQSEPMVATGTVSLDGEAWLTAVIHGDDTLQAIGTIELRGYARLTSGEVLPPTDDLGWTAPDVTTPDLRGLVVKVAGLAIQRAQSTDLVIELDTEGGPKSATLSVNCALTRAPLLMQSLVVTYKGQTLFRGRLENIASNIDSSTGYTLTYAGPLVTLRDHKAFRTVYVDSDLQHFSTEQGPRTSPDTFSGITAGSA